MQISKRAWFILAEATATSVLGLINTGAGVALTFGLAFVHIRTEKTMLPPPPNVLVQQVSGQSSTLQRLEESTEEAADAE